MARLNRTISLPQISDDPGTELDVATEWQVETRPLVSVTDLEPRRRNWLIRHLETAWTMLIVLAAGVAQAINMFGIPYYENDEGTYMSQAWAILHDGALAPYTYIYDHAPVGWIQIAAWTVLTHGFDTFGNAINTGRVLMLVFQLGSTWLVYRIARNVSGSVITASLAALLFALSPFGIYYHRRVLLDNIATFWMLLSLLLLLSRRLTLTRVWLSAVAIGVSILSKEVTVFVVPAFAALAAVRSHRSNRWFAVTGWIALMGSSVSLYILMAVLKGELFPDHTFLGGSRPHVSLITTLKWQASRSKDGGIMDPHSGFWRLAHVWVNEDPVLVVGGTLCALLSLLLLLNRNEKERAIGALGLATLGIWAFMARGGEVLDFYLVPALPLLALNISLIIGLLLRPLRVAGMRVRGELARPAGVWTGIVALTVAAATVTACVDGGLHDTYLGFAYDHELLWNLHQTTGQNQALQWVQRHVPTSKSVIVDDFMWTDLHDGDGGKVFPLAHWYWKLGFDPAVEGGVFHNNWKNVNYIVTTPQMLANVAAGHDAPSFKMIDVALKHSKIVAHFESDNWTVNVRRVYPGTKGNTLPKAAR
jgi:4-amino-4-deoxy-L-arabinose transferase-like glycosyltransferase